MTSISQLTPLLPTTPYLLAYSLPLLLLSILLTFSGTFLTLDRSRSFPPTDPTSGNTGKGYSAVPGAYALEKPKGTRLLRWSLEGGIGGLAGGYVFGLHLSTALALLIPAKTPSASLSSNSFLAIWILSCLVTTPLAGRYRYVTLAFFGVSGGTLTALALCIIIHPSLSPRVILVCIFLSLFTLSVLLSAVVPVPRITENILRPVLRVCTASTGAFGIVMAVALLLNPKQEGWANAWERLWTENGPAWGTGREQGLSAAYFAFLVVGMAVDWSLKRLIGECPDEKWDSYLAHYAANLPNQADRAGTFQPLTTFWDRFFSGSNSSPRDIIFPNETDLKSHLPLPLPVTSRNMASGNLSKPERGMELTRVSTSAELLKKRRSKAQKGTGWRKMAEAGERKERKPIKFGAISDDSDTDDDDDTKIASTLSSPISASPNAIHAKRPWIVKNTQHSTSSSTTPTLVGTKSDPRLETLGSLDYDKEIARLKIQRKTGDEKDDLDYSDYEEDLTTQKLRGKEVGEGAWSPAFLKRHQSEQAVQMPVPVPATPSLIKALDRLAVAQRDAFGPAAAPGATQREARSTSMSLRPTVTPEDAEVGGGAGAPKGIGTEAEDERAPRWEEFWREVRVKALS